MSPIIHGYKIDSQGKSTKINTNVIEADEALNYIWFHLDSGHKNARQWLLKRSDLPELVINNLLSNQTRPNIQHFKSGTLLTLRGMNFNENASPEDMIALNIWIEPHHIITMGRHKILAIEDIVKLLNSNNSPINSGMFLSLLFKSLNKRIGEVVDTIQDESDEVEKLLLNNVSKGLRLRCSSLRRKILKIRRYLIPQREVLNKLYNETFTWLNEKDKLLLRDSSERLISYIEDLDVIREHAALNQEEIVNMISEQMNQSMHILGVVVALFIPLGFITGILGINVSGIPGANNSNAFFIVSVICAIIFVVEYIIFKWRKKI